MWGCAREWCWQGLCNKSPFSHFCCLCTAHCTPSALWPWLHLAPGDPPADWVIQLIENPSQPLFVFVQIKKCICPNSKMYLSKLLNVFCCLCTAHCTPSALWPWLHLAPGDPRQMKSCNLLKIHLPLVAKPMQICLLSGRQFEQTFENTHWRKVKPMQPSAPFLSDLDCI